MIHTLEITNVYSEIQGELNTVFHYVASEETGISDGDTYITVKLTHEHPFKSSYEELHNSKAPLIFKHGKEFWTTELLEHVRPISEAEYLEFKKRKENEEKQEIS